MGLAILSTVEPTGVKDKLAVGSGRWEGIEVDSKVFGLSIEETMLPTYKDKEEQKG